ncbi:uncharacterized protein CC84DRAFT_1166318 [Paraphaeosphaeria sporulosa]|uniref:Uncharacterized protein n=1 Tax=Paraphaeosphaeria sporulosa TaxID=1460663 RepID=A0A177C8Z7_9PLEO|nr:uncharacterized protein CC84DRAFT_1166318 [Paraphaeosphaeria sporulosa]OAG04224.1 hypothetical protein CC84DRAFT_1166318 [Paraphaeosphaeria sporulosa]
MSFRIHTTTDFRRTYLSGSLKERKEGYSSEFKRHEACLLVGAHSGCATPSTTIPFAMRKPCTTQLLGLACAQRRVASNTHVNDITKLNYRCLIAFVLFANAGSNTRAFGGDEDHELAGAYRARWMLCAPSLPRLVLKDTVGIHQFLCSSSPIQKELIRRARSDPQAKTCSCDNASTTAKAQLYTPPTTNSYTDPRGQFTSLEELQRAMNRPGLFLLEVV